MISYNIRIGRKKDSPACINLSKTSWPRWWSQNEKLGERHIRSCIKDNRCLVTVKNREVIAFLVWNILWNKIHLQDIFVEKKYRKMGIGSSMVRRLIELSKRQGFKEIMSDSDVSNKVALTFHIKNGFKKCGFISKNWDNESSFVYTRKI